MATSSSPPFSSVVDNGSHEGSVPNDEFVDGLVLPPHILAELQKLVLPGGVNSVAPGVSEFLWGVCKAFLLRETSLHLCDCVLRVLDSTGSTAAFLSHTITTEIQDTSSAHTLFRSNCVATRLLSQYFKMRGAAYLKHCLSHTIASLQSEPSLEVDVVKLQQAASSNGNANSPSTPPVDMSFWESKAKENALRVVQLSQRLFDHICSSVDQCPMSFRLLFAHAKQQVQHRFPAAASLVVGGFIFLRFLCPAIVAPEGHGLLSGSIAPAMRRNLVLISKLMQTLANGVTEGLVSHPVFTAFLTINAEACSSFYTNLTNVVPDTKNTAPTVTVYATMTDDLAYIFTKVLKNFELFNESTKEFVEMRKQVQELVNSATTLEKGNNFLTRLFKKATKAATVPGGSQGSSAPSSTEEMLKKEIMSKLEELTQVAHINAENESQSKLKKMQQEIEQLKKELQIEKELRLKLAKEVDKKHIIPQVPRLFSKGISTSTAVEAVTKFEPASYKELVNSASLLSQRTQITTPPEFAEALSIMLQKPQPPQPPPLVLVPSQNQIHLQNSVKQFQDLNMLVDVAFQRIEGLLLRLDESTIIYRSIILAIGTVMKDLTKITALPLAEHFEPTPVAALQSAAIGPVTPEQVEHLMKIAARVLGQCREYLMNIFPQDITLQILPSLSTRVLCINNMLDSCCVAIGYTVVQPTLNFPSINRNSQPLSEMASTVPPTSTSPTLCSPPPTSTQTPTLPTQLPTQQPVLQPAPSPPLLPPTTAPLPPPQTAAPAPPNAAPLPQTQTAAPTSTSATYTVPPSSTAPSNRQPARPQAVAPVPTQTFITATPQRRG
ncbi:gtpase-activator protein for Ras family gtpase [Pelomyxa schiedti]|nr:gtpase-activator protein for Ras family gtpase [Pelomyxa schiedti]